MINMAQAVYAESFCYLHKHGPVFNIHYLLRFHLGCIQCNSEYISIRFSEMNKTGNNKKISQFIKLKLFDTIFANSRPSLLITATFSPGISFLTADQQRQHIRDKVLIDRT